MRAGYGNGQSVLGMQSNVLAGRCLALTLQHKHDLFLSNMHARHHAGINTQTLCKGRATRLVPVFLVLLATAAPVFSLDRPPWDKMTTTVGPDAEVPGWYLNLGITGARAMITKEDPANLLVMHVFKDTPAYGKLEKGDKITGVNGRTFVTSHKFGYGVGKFGYDGPMMDLGNALEESQGKLGGKLALDILRGDHKQTAELQLTTRYGSFATTYPFDCKKTNTILKETCDWLLKEQKPDGTWSGRPHINAFAALALLGSGDAACLPAVKKAMEVMARATDGKLSYGGLPCWNYGIYGIALGEYYLITREDWVLPELEKTNRWLVGAQHPETAPPNRRHIAGGFGHGLLNPKGGNSYGAFNAVTAQAMMAWDLMERCGLPVDHQRLEAAHQFIAKGTNDIGYVWYADEVGGAGYADMGRTGSSALAHFLDPLGGEPFKTFAKRNAECIGNHPDTFIDTHGCPLIGMVWTALGAATDPASLRKLMDANRWAFSLSQCPDGTFYYQPNRDNNPQDYAAAPRLSATAATALILSLGEKRLQITGAKPVMALENRSRPPRNSGAHSPEERAEKARLILEAVKKNAEPLPTIKAWHKTDREAPSGTGNPEVLYNPQCEGIQDS